jgi:hypothetical protein
MEMGARHPTGRADLSDDLTAFDDLPFLDLDLAHVHVDRDEARAVIQVDDVTGVVEVSDQGDDGAIPGANGLA